MRQPVHGVLLLDKPLGFTSNQALQKIKWLFNAVKAGHTGSLDPLATGMLPICFGEATKFSQFLLESDKVYEVTAQLGVKTTTGDAEGEVVATYEMSRLTHQQIEQVMKQFVGEINQIPPMFSALKHQGTPLYQLARKGIEIERESRCVTIFDLTLETVVANQISFRVHCSKGTYVRTLVEDIGKALGGGAYVVKLHRTHVSPYQDQVVYSLSVLEEIKEKMGVPALHACLLPVETAVNQLPAVHLSTAAAFYLRMGQPVRATLASMTQSLVRLFLEDVQFLGIGEVLADGRIKPHRLLSAI